MEMLHIKFHFAELRSRLIHILFFYLIFTFFCYFFKEKILQLLISPLANSTGIYERKIIYTGLTEAFFSYIKLAFFGSFIMILPFISFHIYGFIGKGLYKHEKFIAGMLLSCSPILFYLGSFFVFYYVMPKAWFYFLSFENNQLNLPLVLEARISEYLNLVIQLIIAFGIAFQVPIILIILNLLGIIKVDDLIKKRRVAIVINFILGGILTPPDIISQFALAIPLLLLYEISIIVCKFLENRESNARYQVD